MGVKIPTPLKKMVSDPPPRRICIATSKLRAVTPPLSCLSPADTNNHLTERIPCTSLTGNNGSVDAVCIVHPACVDHARLRHHTNLLQCCAGALSTILKLQYPHIHAHTRTHAKPHRLRPSCVRKLVASRLLPTPLPISAGLVSHWDAVPLPAVAARQKIQASEEGTLIPQSLRPVLAFQILKL